MRFIFWKYFIIFSAINLSLGTIYSQNFVNGGPKPGDKYKEFYLSMGIGSTLDGNEWRVTDPNINLNAYPQAAAFLPNAQLPITIDDLTGATKAEFVLDIWEGHPGTTGKEFRVNGNNWIPVPEVTTTPTNPSYYMSQRNAIVQVPLSDLVSGNNIIEGNSGPQAGPYNFGWGQWGWYGIVVRIYYGTTSTDYAGSVLINGSGSGTSFGDNPTVSFSPNLVLNPERVDFLGYYEGWDIDGDGFYKDWQREYHRDNTQPDIVIDNIVGKATSSPYSVTWNTSWVPDQEQDSVKLIARVKSTDGFWYVTDKIENLTLQRDAISIKLFKPSNVPERYWVRGSSIGSVKSHIINIPASYNLSVATSAIMLTSTWNGRDKGTLTNSTLFNGNGISDHGLYNYYKYDQVNIPVGYLQLGNNTVTYQSNESVEHGIEINWPGSGLYVKFDYSLIPPVITQQPGYQGVLEGQPAQFSVVAEGFGINYQWQKDGVDIPGATSSTYTTPATSLGDNGSIFRVVVSNTNGAINSDEVALYVTAINQRTDQGQLVLYNFDEGTGITVNDNSGYGTPLNLTIQNAGAVTWETDGLRINSETRLTSGAASKISTAVKSTNEITIESWIAPQTVSLITNDVPARIISMSLDGSNRNFTLGQGTYVYNQDNPYDLIDTRLRTTATNNNGDNPSTKTATGTLTTNMTHVVYTRSADGTTKIYLNGVLSTQSSVSGDLSNWNDSYSLILANEVGISRKWLGKFSLVSIYNRVLNETEVYHNYSLGEGVQTPPVVITQPVNQEKMEGSTASFAITAVGTTPLSYQWQKNNTDIPGANSANYTTSIVTLADNGATFRCIVTNVNGADTSNSAVLTVTSGAPVITQQPADTTLGSGQSAFFFVSVTGAVPFTYQWKKNGADILGAEDSTYTTPALEIGDDGAEFTVLVSNAYGSVESNAATTTVLLIPPEPQIDIWFGDNQKFGHLGNPQRWVNILGNVSDPDGISSLTYKLNGGTANTLNTGPDTRRLLSAGDFNVEIDTANLNPGLNTIEIIAEDNLNFIATRTVNVNYTPSVRWQKYYSIDWDTVTNLQNVIQVVDGNWEVENGYLKNIDQGYDRSFAIGDVAWDDYEAEFSFIMHEHNGTYSYPSYGPAIGHLFRWTGHTDNRYPGWQPKAGFEPYGALGWYQFINQFGNRKFQIYGNDLALRAEDAVLVIPLNTLYHMKMEVRTDGSGVGVYKLKYWQDGSPEPGWLLTATATNGAADPARGSILFIIHQMKVSIGDITVKPIVDGTYAYLQGPFNGTDMNTILKSSNLIPNNQPYNTSPWNYTGLEFTPNIPANIVDWVLVEVRTSTEAASLVERRAAFLRNDGKIVDLDGISDVPFPSLSEGFYYLIVKHRNHLGVMSKTPAYYNNNHFEYDFRLKGSAYGTDPMKDLGSGVFGMIACDANKDGYITGSDFNIFNPKFFQAVSGYDSADWNLDGYVTGSDFNIFNPNFYNARSTQVPF